MGLARVAAPPFWDQPVRPAPVDLAGMSVYRSGGFPADGQAAPWLDGPDADARIAARLAAGEITEAEADLCRRWARDGYLILEGFYPADRLDRLRGHRSRLRAADLLPGQPPPALSALRRARDRREDRLRRLCAGLRAGHPGADRGAGAAGALFPAEEGRRAHLARQPAARRQPHEEPAPDPQGAGLPLLRRRRDLLPRPDRHAGPRARRPGPLRPQA